METVSSSTSRNPRPPDDTVFYSIYPDLSTETSPDSALRRLHLQILSIVGPHVGDYIWQHEPFHLSVPSAGLCRLCNSPASIPHLHGKTRYGDSIDDEWFAVFLLYEISRAIPSASIRAWDSDGEFLLIESAFALPRWINPSNSQNRVFIRSGELHIIPLPLPSTPTLPEALRALRSGEVPTRAPDPVQLILHKRISAYPEKSRTGMHRARARVPISVARVLKHEPCLISLAVEAFYDRDVDSMKHASRMERFLGEEEGREMVRVSARMSRAMYGQLVQQRFQAPKFYPMPGREEGPTAYAEAELGLKIACGFEMMYQGRRRDGDEGKGPTWDAFRQSLESSGCFQGLLPGSKEYKRIMDGALAYYKNSSLFSHTRDMMNAPIARIDEILSLPFFICDFNGSELPPNDDDSWLFNGEDELNSAILERQKEMEIYQSGRRKHKGKGQQDATGNTFGSQSDDFNLGDIAETMQAFVQKISSFEGAEIPQNRNSKAVELDAHQFMKELESVMGPTRNEGTTCDTDFDENTSSSDMDFDDSEDESDLVEHGDSGTGDTFLQSYSDALNEELSGTTLKRSFILAQQQSNNHEEGTSNTAGDVDTAAKDMDEDLTPVDVDVNLVKSFLDSFSSQQGLPGPASNLLGLLGLEIPLNAEKKI